MAIRGVDFDILGLTISRCGPVDGLLHLQVDDGLTALYGLNGAGKTQYLRLFREVLEGGPISGQRQWGFADIHLRLHPQPNEARKYDPRSSSARHFFSYLRERMLGDIQERIDQLKSADSETDARNPLSLTTAIPALLEACAEGRVTLRAAGVEGAAGGERGRFWVLPAVSPASPAGAAFLAEAEAVFRARRPDGGERQPTLLPPLASVVYWGSDTDPHWIGEVPGDLQVPLDWDLGATGDDFRLVQCGGNLPAPFDPDAATQAELRVLCEVSGLEYYEPGTDELSEDLRFEILEMENRANQLLSAVLAPAPRLSWSVPTPTEMALGERPRWVADGAWDLSRASEAQRRWIQFALEAARPRGEEPFIMLLDEPESGLHRLAEHRIPSGLHAWTTHGGASAIFVATHSPDLLSSSLAQKVLVSRAEMGATLRPVVVGLSGADAGRQAASELGLAVGDLWALSKLVVVVEGIHDQWVFESLLRSELDSAVAAVLPMHGGTRLRSLAEARLLMDGTDAEILVVLDDLDASVAVGVAEQINRAAKSSDVNELKSTLEDLRKRGQKNDSLLFLHQFFVRAASLGDLGRVHIHGLSLPDVVCYLDPETVLLDPQPWDVLLNRWTADAAPNQPKNLKGWLRRQRLLPDDPQQVDEAVAQAVLRTADERRPLHPDLVSLGLRIAELGVAKP